MLDSLEIWTKYDPQLGQPDNSEGAYWQWLPGPGDKAQLANQGPVYVHVTENAGDRRDALEEIGRLRATIQVPELLGLCGPNQVWEHFRRIPEALEATFEWFWEGEHPPFEKWRVLRLDATYDFPLPPGVDLQEVIDQLSQIEPPDFVPSIVGKRGHRTLYWQTQGAKGRPADRPDIIRIYEKARQLEDTGAPLEVAEAFRGILRLEYQVHHEHGVMQAVLKREPKAAVYMHDIVNPMSVYRILRRAVDLLRLEELTVGTLDAYSVLRDKYGNDADTLYKHYLWIQARGEEAWLRAHSQATQSRTRQALDKAGLWPVMARPVAVPLVFPLAYKLAGENQRKKIPSVKRRR